MHIKPSHPDRRHALALGLGVFASSYVRAQTADVLDETWLDLGRRREIPVRVRWPLSALSVPAGGLPLVLFSHGLGGTRAGGDVWGQAWAAAGFVVLHLQHPGSDLDAARRVASSFADAAALRGIGNAQQLIARLQDVVFVLDEIARRQRADVATPDKRWAGVRADGIGLSGHSFGAHTTLGVGGQSYPGYAGMNEPRIAALAAFSPTLPVRDDAQQAFAGIKRPVLCLTGTLDGDVLGNGASPAKRAGVFAALPPGNKAQLVLKDADHMTFGGQTGRAADILPRAAATQSLQAAQHALIARITTDWWRAHLLADVAAKARLLQPSGLTPQDSWQTG
ncbi:MAG: dienelactone hydrolase [Polaromonas sp.]|nr:dienelactone hydrolase [Polaromonas sp.]